MENVSKQNYFDIFKQTISYIPSKILVMIYTLIIVPLFANILSIKEMSIYFIAIQVLNIICTASSDWITKSILRFHEKYTIKNKIEDFYSNLLWITSIAYAIVIFIYCILKNTIQTHLGFDTITFILTISLVVPCGLRQLLYQYLRVINKPLLYTISLLLYQTSFIGIFLILAKSVPNAGSLLLAMNIAVIAVDLFVIQQTNFKIKFKTKINSPMLKETIKYASPLILTNICYWTVIHFSKLYFQNATLYTYTAIIGIFSLFAYNFIQPVGSVFGFASFPELVSEYEHKRPINIYWTNIMRLYTFCIFPLVLTFCYFYKDITKLIFPAEYHSGAILLPLFATAAYIHEFLKLLTSKYHLKNKTYIEMIIAIAITILAIILNIVLINKYAYMGAGLAILITEFFLVTVNSCIKFKNFEYVNFFKILKSTAMIIFLGLIVYGIVHFIFKAISMPSNAVEILILDKIFLYIVLLYLACVIYKKQILK